MYTQMCLKLSKCIFTYVLKSDIVALPVNQQLIKASYLNSRRNSRRKFTIPGVQLSWLSNHKIEGGQYTPK